MEPPRVWVYVMAGDPSISIGLHVAEVLPLPRTKPAGDGRSEFVHL